MANPQDPHRLHKLTGVHPFLVDAVTRIADALEVLGFRLIVTDGVRTMAVQQALYAQGRSTPGPIVTNADGMVRRSNHQTHPDGLGHAVDCCFLDANGTPSWDPKRFPFALYGAMAKVLGLVWGGSWGHLADLPHIELADGVPRTGAAAALQAATPVERSADAPA